MANLKELRNKISVVQSTRKVTSAMKLVAGVKLRKAEQQASGARDYSDALNCIVNDMILRNPEVEHNLITQRKNIKCVMLVVIASDRGLCGNFNSLILSKARNMIRHYHNENICVKLVCAGIKIVDDLRRELNKTDDIEVFDDFFKSNSDLSMQSKQLSQYVINDYSSKRVDAVDIVFTKYYSAMRRSVETNRLIPLVKNNSVRFNQDCIFEPDIKVLLDEMLPHNIFVQLYQAAVDSFASEQSSRMTSMDNATRNADDLLSELTIKYNRTRQYIITQELMEVISGASAIAKE